MRTRPDNRFSKNTLIVLFLFCSASVALASQPQQVDSLSGTVEVSGSMLAMPCSLATESIEQTVDLGIVPLWQLESFGSLSEPVMFHLYLRGCEYGRGFVRNISEGNNGLLVPNQPVVAMTLQAVSDATDPRLVALVGEARGVGLRIDDAAHRQLKPGVKGTFLPLVPGDNEFIMTAQLSRTGQTLAVGDFMATVNIALEYQ